MLFIIIDYIIVAMFVQTENTPNPNSLKFIPGKKVSNFSSYEISNKLNINNEAIRNILSINGVKSIFLSKNFLSVNKEENVVWEDLKHIIISFINDHYSKGNSILYDKKSIHAFTGNNIVFHAGTKLNRNKELVTNGGRVLNIISKQQTLEKRKAEAYKLIKSIKSSKNIYTTTK